MKYKIWAEFYRLGHSICGSDGLMPLDGRWAQSTRVYMARQKAKQLNENLGKGIDGFRICQGEISKLFYTTGIIPIEPKDKLPL